VPAHKLAFIKEKCAVKMCAPHTYFRPGVHTVSAEIAAGEMIRRKLNIRLSCVFQKILRQTIAFINVEKRMLFLFV
ncbi:hypothetical protein, partial [Salmonella sp. gx-f7]|uniref:hypothetical protein n=1 Tax=Salmonella sp. gx-f7 TaxID=2582606 RepID=UPI001F40697B